MVSRGKPNPASQLEDEVSRLDRTLGPLRLRALAWAESEPGGLREILRYARPGKASFDVRPLLFRCGFEYGCGCFRQVLPVALALQLANAATVVVDDVIDHSAQRDGRATVHSVFGLERAVLVSVILKASASQVFLRALEDNPDLPDAWAAYRCFEEAYSDLHLGQYLDLESQATDFVDEDVYFHIIYLTTGRLMEASLLIGGLLGGVASSKRAQLIRFGKVFGLIHQVRDDLADYWPEKFDLGRPAGEDLRERKVRLPILYALQPDSPQAAPLRRILKQGALKPGDVLRVRKLLEDAGAFERVWEQIRKLSHEADDCLRQLGEGKSTHWLRSLLRYFAQT